MRIESVTIRGFRCFDDSGATIDLDDMTCFVGPNASGKTAAMIALARLFGESRQQRDVVPGDFHLANDEVLNSKPTRTLSIECRLGFPELEGDEPAATGAVPETFNQMIVDEPTGSPYCRVRLEATWTDDGTPTGDVDQSLFWILTNSKDPKEIEDHKRQVFAGARSKVRLVYVPAARDPSQQIRSTTTTSFGRLLKAMEWGEVDEALRQTLSELRGKLDQLSGLQTLNSKVAETWQDFYSGRVAHELSFQAVEEDPADLLKSLAPTFRPGQDGREMAAASLSEGHQSLFSLSLAVGLFQVEDFLRSNAGSGFKPDLVEALPVLTLFAIEEPENHLSPHYLGRVVAQLAGLGQHDRAQVLISSHSPCILGRVPPERVRYFLGHERTSASHVTPIKLPEKSEEEAFKFVREAVLGHPELYFARLVVLGEGPSEQIVLKRLFEASGTPLDTHFISVVPLGGRHVNHFWRLLHELEIPFLTLLDLDREKEGGGWGRFQYVRDQLVGRYGEGHEALQFTEGERSCRLEDDEWDSLAQNSDTVTVEMESWLEFFRVGFDVFFSPPLDLDFAMLAAFPEAYKGLAQPPKGPRGASTAEAINQRVRQVLAADASAADEDLGSSYSADQKELFAWYKYLFVDRSKPVTHMRALLSVKDLVLAQEAPDFLRQLLERAKDLLLEGNLPDGPNRS